MLLAVAFLWDVPGLGALVKWVVILWGIGGVLAFTSGSPMYFAWTFLWPVMMPGEEEMEELEAEAQLHHHEINQISKKGTFSEQEQYKRYLEFDGRSFPKGPEEPFGPMD